SFLFVEGITYQTNGKILHVENLKHYYQQPANYSINWFALHKVTHVFDQFSCGSCYAFASADAVASFNAIQTGELHELSQEDIIACSWAYGNYGCDGGWITQAFQYVIEHGLDSLLSYPYETCIVPGTCWCSIKQFCECNHK